VRDREVGTDECKIEATMAECEELIVCVVACMGNIMMRTLKSEQATAKRMLLLNTSGTVVTFNREVCGTGGTATSTTEQPSVTSALKVVFREAF